MIDILILRSIKKPLACLISAGLLFCALPAAGAATQYQANIVINQAPVTIPEGDQPAIILKGRTYVPLRIISENLGTSVTWQPETKQVLITTSNGNSSNSPERGVQPAGIQIVVDGQPLEIAPDLGEAFISNNRTMVPFRVIGEALDCGISWEQSTRTVDIKTKPVAPQIPEQPPVVTPTQPEPQPEPEPSVVDRAVLQELVSYRTNLKLMNGDVINSADLLQMEQNITQEQMSRLKTYRDQLSKYSSTIKLPDGKVLNTADIFIMGPSVATADQMNAWLAGELPRVENKLKQQYNRELVPIPENLAELYLKIGEEYGIRGDLAFAQAAKETHYFQFTGDVQPWQNNYCGLYAIGSPLTGQEPLRGADANLVRFEEGVHGAIFASPEAGVEAHIQHLYAYAVKGELPSGKTLVDPRYILVSRGIAPNWLGLNARWAVPGTTYGQSIIQDYWKAILAK